MSEPDGAEVGAIGSTSQRQHVIPEWLLKAFAAGQPRLVGYDKIERRYETLDPADFMVELGAHSTAVEDEISRLETPAAEAARRLAKRVKVLPAGMYAVVEEGAAAVSTGPAFSDEGKVREIRVLVSEHVVGAPTAADRTALARFAGLMYQRSPKTEAAILAWGAAFEAGVQRVVDDALPGKSFHPWGGLEHRRERVVELSRTIGDRLEAGSWWVVRAATEEGFVLSDTPAVAVGTLGHDGPWRAILANDAFAVVMPLGPAVALIMATQHLLPVSGIEGAAEMATAINRLMWRFAERYVLARSEAQLEASTRADPGLRELHVRVDQDHEAIAGQGVATAQGILSQAHVEYTILRPLEAHWQRWDGCRLVFGYAVFAASDRDMFVGPGGVAAPCIIPRGKVGPRAGAGSTDHEFATVRARTVKGSPG